MNTIRKYNGKVTILFDTWGDNFTLKVPHYKKWLAAIKYLTQRGFSITENPSFKEHYGCLTKYHRIGFKKDVACLMEIGPAFIRVQFGNIKNLWTGIVQSFWDNPSDDRYTKLTYLEEMAVKLEIKKICDLFSRWNAEIVKEDNELQPVEYILRKLRVNSHIHGEVNCLDDIKKSITPDSYNFKHNSNDANNKKITCGDLKYFYHWKTKRLSCGIVWHNINNMWWVLYGNHEKSNIASFNLFDFNSSLPKREPVTPRQIDRLLERYSAKKDYKRCMHIKHYAENKLATCSQQPVTSI